MTHTALTVRLIWRAILKAFPKNNNIFRNTIPKCQCYAGIVGKPIMLKIMQAYLAEA